MFTTDIGVGHPIAKIINGKNKKKGNIVSFIGRFDDNEDLETEYNTITLKEGKVKPIPDITKEREVLYITGQSGSGKTYFTKEYLKEYLQFFKDREIYLFSAIPYDPEDDDYKEINIKRMKMDESLKDLNAKDFDKCCVIFDDMDCFKDGKILKIITKLRDEMLETGRHHKTTIIITYHLPTGGHDTRRLINEATSVVYFPHSATGKVRNLLVNYLDFKDEQVDKLQQVDSRWVMIRKHLIPNVILTEKFICKRQDI